MKRSVFALYVTLFLAWSPVQAMVDWCAPAALLGSFAGLAYDLRHANIRYKEYRQKFTLKRRKQNLADQEPTKKALPRRTKPRSFSSFYTKRLVRGKQNISIISALTGIGSLIYLLTQKNATSATAPTPNSSPRQSPTNLGGDTLPQNNVPQPHIEIAAELPHTQQPVLQQSGAECGLHAAFNAQLLAHRAVVISFFNNELFERFKQRALAIIAEHPRSNEEQRKGNWISSEHVNQIMVDPEICALFARASQRIPTYTFFPANKNNPASARLQGLYATDPAVNRRSDLQKLLVEHKEFVVICADHSINGNPERGHFFALRVTVDAQNKIQITSTDSLYNPDQYVQNLLAQLSDPTLPALVAGNSFTEKELYDPTTNSFITYPKFESDDIDNLFVREIEVPVLQQPIRPDGHYRQNCGTHTAFNVLLFARGASSDEFNDQALFDRFRARAIQIMGRTDENGMHAADVLNILRAPEIHTIAGYTDESAPYLVVADGLVRQNTEHSFRILSKGELRVFMAMHNAFSVGYLHSSHFMTFHFSKDAENTWTISRAESAVRASNKELSFERVIETLFDPELKLLHDIAS